jgi:hypothetical protein
MNDEEFEEAETRHAEGKMIAGVVTVCGSVVVWFTYVALNVMGYL